MSTAQQRTAEGNLAPRVMLLGIAGARLGVIRALAARGTMPTFARLLSEGALATSCTNTNVSKTHPGWISIASGASTGTHRVHSWRFSDDGLSGFRMALLGAHRQAEYIWEAAERQGKRVIVLAWPDSWPPRLERGLQVGGACLGPNATFYEGALDWPINRGPVHRFAVGADEYLSTAPQEGMSPLKFEELGASAAAPRGIASGLAVRLPLRCYHADRPLRHTPVFWMIIPTGGAEALLYADGAWQEPLAQVAVGQWSARMDVEIPTEGGPLRAGVRIKLLSLDVNTRHAALYVTPVCALDDGRIHPQGAAPEIAQLAALAMPTPVFLSAYAAHLLDYASQRELLEMSNRWYVEAATALLQRPFDLFAMMSNNIDWAEHAVWQQRDATRQESLQFLTDCYADLDRMVGDILEAVPAGTAVCLVSEHGAIDPWDALPAPSPQQVLRAAGLLVLDETGRVDVARSHAFVEEDLIHVLPKRPATAEGRALRAERIRETLAVLAAARVPGTDERLFTVVLPWEDAWPFGYHGEAAGDIVAFRPAAYGGIHGDAYPLAATGWSDLRPMVLLWGTGVRAGAEEARPTRLEDIAPTLASLLGIQPPRQCEGRPLWGLLGDDPAR